MDNQRPQDDFRIEGLEGGVIRGKQLVAWTERVKAGHKLLGQKFTLHETRRGPFSVIQPVMVAWTDQGIEPILTRFWELVARVKAGEAPPPEIVWRVTTLVEDFQPGEILMGLWSDLPSGDRLELWLDAQALPATLLSLLAGRDLRVFAQDPTLVEGGGDLLYIPVILPPALAETDACQMAIEAVMLRVVEPAHSFGAN